MDGALKGSICPYPKNIPTNLSIEMLIATKNDNDYWKKLIKNIKCE